MAVQAQYPSNVFLFNRNGGQDTKNMLSINNNNNNTNNYPLLQPSSQPGTGFLLDQSQSHHHLLLPTNTNGAVTNAQKNSPNPRKRGRDVMGGGGGGGTSATAATTTTTSTAANNNYHHHHHMQNHHHPPHQLIELSRLQQQQQQSPINAVVSTGLKLSSFGDHHQIQQQQQMQPNHHNNNSTQCCSLPSPLPLFSSSSSDHLVNQINQQSEDLNQLIHTHVEQLHRTVTEKRQRHYHTLLTAAEESLTRRLRDKETQLEQAARRHAELESRAAQLSAEAQLWQAKARAQEAQAASLQAQLQQAMMLAAAGSKPGADRDGLRSEGGEAEDAESAYIDPERVVATNQMGTTTAAAVPGCRACGGARAATVVILPCRHLCVCVECDGVVQSCPVCLGMRNSSVEVFLT